MTTRTLYDTRRINNVAELKAAIALAMVETPMHHARAGTRRQTRLRRQS